MKKLRMGLRLSGMVCTALLLVAAVGSTIDSIWCGDLWIARQLANSASCQNNHKQMGLAIRMYTNESAGETYPPLSPESGRLMMLEDSIYPEYIHEPELLICPGRSHDDPVPHFDDTHHIYLGYVLTCDEDVLGFVDAYRAEIAAGGDFTSDLPGAVTYHTGDTIFRLKEGMERFLITDISNPAAGSLVRSQIPIMMDWPDNFQFGMGGNVLYMDGHVEWQYYPGEWPMTETTINALADLANYVPPTRWNDGSNAWTDEFPDYDAWVNRPCWDTPASDGFLEFATSSGFASSCQNQLKQLGLIYKMYANESAGSVYPPLPPEGGILAPILEEIYPEYCREQELFVCPGPAPAPFDPLVDDHHYAYIGYWIHDEASTQDFVEAYAAQLAGGGDFTGDLPIPSKPGEDVLRLREGMERFLITDINNPAVPIAWDSGIPLMIEWPGNHQGATGGHVLYLDGHVEWLAYPSEWPMTEATITALDSIADWTPTTAWAERVYTSIELNDPYGFGSACKNQFKQLGLVCDMYANESPGEVYPQLPTEAGRLMFQEADVYPNYIVDPELTTCPGADLGEPGPFWDDEHYIYLGYMLQDDADVQAFAAAYTAELAGGGDFSGDFSVPSSYGSNIYRLKEGIERFLITDINNPGVYFTSQSGIPVMIEWPDNHEGVSGGHVLYMDGHVEWHDYPGEWPMTETTITTLDGLATWNRSTEWATKYLPPEGDPYKQRTCENNCKWFGIVFKMYANSRQGELFPHLNPVAGNLSMDVDQFLPFYLKDLRKMNCPGSANALREGTMDDHSYAYLGYLIKDQEALELFADAYRAQIAAGGDFSEDLDFGGETLLHIHEGNERFLITDINNPAAPAFSQSKIPVLVEWPDNHGNLRRGHVLYMDGHVEWLEYPSKFPMTEAAMAILTDLAGRPPIAPPPPARDSSLLRDLLLQDGAPTRR